MCEIAGENLYVAYQNVFLIANANALRSSVDFDYPFPITHVERQLKMHIKITAHKQIENT